MWQSVVLGSVWQCNEFSFVDKSIRYSLCLYDYILDFRCILLLFALVCGYVTMHTQTFSLLVSMIKLWSECFTSQPLWRRFFSVNYSNCIQHELHLIRSFGRFTVHSVPFFAMLISFASPATTYLRMRFRINGRNKLRMHAN